jgi:hypothetical protein
MKAPVYQVYTRDVDDAVYRLSVTVENGDEAWIATVSYPTLGLNPAAQGLGSSRQQAIEELDFALFNTFNDAKTKANQEVSDLQAAATVKFAEAAKFDAELARF